MAVKVIQIDGVGDVTFEHSRRAKHINLSVKPFHGVRVAVPLRVSLRQAETVARSKTDWIKKHQSRAAKIEQKALRFNAGNKIDAATARSAIIKRLGELAEANGFDYGDVSIRNQKTRWGSCSSNHNISLNIQIAQLPPRLMDYIILHELVHTRIRNHGVRFWKELDKLIHDPKHLDRELNEYGFLLAR